MTVKDIYERCDFCKVDSRWFIINEDGDPLVDLWGVRYLFIDKYHDREVYHFTFVSCDEVIVWLE